MSIGDTITMTLGGSGGTAKVLTKVSDANYTSEYFLREATATYRLTVKHTVPAGRSGGVESHLFRFDVETYDAENVLLRKESTWSVFETRQGIQADTSLTAQAKALVYVMDATLIGKLLGRQS